MAQELGGIGRHPGWSKQAPKTERAQEKHRPHGPKEADKAHKTSREDSVSIGNEKPGEGPVVQEGQKASQAAAADRMQQTMAKIEEHYNSQIDAIKNSESYKQALEDLQSGKGVTTTASGSTMYHAAAEEGVPAYVIFDGRIFLAAESDGYWAVNSGYGDIPEDIEIKAPQEGEEGYGACDLEKVEPEGRDLHNFLRQQANASDTWREMLQGVMGSGSKNWHFKMQGFTRLQISHTSLYTQNKQTGSTFWASQTYTSAAAWYTYGQKTTEDE